MRKSKTSLVAECRCGLAGMKEEYLRSWMRKSKTSLVAECRCGYEWNEGRILKKLD